MDKRRRESRFKASFPIEIEPKGGVLVDMSGGGVAFETDHEYEIGDEIRLQVRVGRGSGKATELECIGRVVRVERRDESFLVGATVEWQEDEGELQTLL
ncbi:MAG: PilZ domain-containing protein [Thermoanaerobaculia bacterium]|nr:PilZ domain-containing protein [Thermoanaerobaculia bacterium]